jgi:UDP:flavonoid glycosyltransferase YjiC (YdhE family)
VATFLMVTHGTAGDVLPFARIGAALRAAGHAATLLTHAPYAAAAARARIEFVPLDTETSYVDRLAATPDLVDARRPADVLRFYERTGLFAMLRHEVDELARRHRPGETVLVGRHTSAVSVLIAAELLGAPCAWVAVSPGQALVSSIAVINMEHGLAGGINAAREACGLPPVSDWRAWFASPDREVGLWPAWFDAAGSPSRPGFELAGFATEDLDQAPPPESVTSLLETVAPPILVTGGSGWLRRHFYQIAIDAVAATGRAGLVVLPHAELLPAALPPDVHWVPRLPFSAVLPRVGAILHHGGIGAAVQAMRAGTPQVILADGADRPDNADRLATLGLAEVVQPGQWAVPVVAEKLTRVLARAATAGPPRAPADVMEPGQVRAAEVLASMLGQPRRPASGQLTLRQRLQHLSPEQLDRLRKRLDTQGGPLRTVE